ncbi:hypothetical protein [Streptantibioticus cattleyicolor]|uniref:N-acetyltransferase domain-containing protein n=1 Tax=Streptantibioticus cattleyicolor (strain ATCC 35852 / DSM 46488 / JCM 4925 / NBRC 14057 / NRRL 8057) TaxID=1003195 RepID=F8JJF0_STREN|nr:hypothetical protein [Streptantibioticus cattleyicolor]AEW98726.1 hypothetical protein SCATT_p05330 [Streptantibioticus cattleyicolor NRRL 8057 = DSM 46488]CCB72220.1 conserved protein of unknown function [Streptantibioticus cattleyicolor NRRL 8057 = DSM 46488]
MTKQSLVQAAARNNAEWCAVMSRSHGLSSSFGRQAWSAPVRTPLYYPDAVTLVPGADRADLLARIDTGVPGASVKDSFADLDLTPAGFQVLFDAQWIHRPASAPAAAPDLAWGVVDSPEMLRAWALAWDDGGSNADLFRPELLDDAATFVLAGRRDDGRVVSGAVASRSGHVVGISNVFALEGGSDAAWPAVLDAVYWLFPALPVVGYEHGEDLNTAVRHGFEAIGPLRIWQRG